MGMQQATHAQYNNSWDASTPKNLIKLNLPSLAIASFSFQYERALTQDVSVALGVRFQPTRSMIFKSTLKTLVDASDSAAVDMINQTTLSSWAITPEFRYYLGRKPSNGFYFAPFVRFGGYRTQWEYDFRKDDGSLERVRSVGNFSNVTAGLMLGAQWHLGKHFLLDWWIAGPAIGTMKIKVSADGDFTGFNQSDRDRLNRNFKQIKLPGGDNPDVVITNDKVTATGNLPFYYLRTGFCIGYTF